MQSHFNCFWEVTISRTSNTVCILEFALRSKESVVSTVSFSRRLTFRFHRKSFCSETGSHPLLNQNVAIMHGREYFSNIAQVVLKDLLHENTLFLTFKKRLKLRKNTSNWTIIYFKMMSSQWMLLFRCKLHTLIFICPICITICYCLFPLSYFGNKFISTDFLHGNFITHQLQALPLALFVSVVHFEF